MTLFCEAPGVPTCDFVEGAEGAVVTGVEDMFNNGTDEPFVVGNVWETAVTVSVECCFPLYVGEEGVNVDGVGEGVRLLWQV